MIHSPLTGTILHWPCLVRHPASSTTGRQDFTPCVEQQRQSARKHVVAAPAIQPIASKHDAKSTHHKFALAAPALHEDAEATSLIIIFLSIRACMNMHCDAALHVLD